MYTFHVFFCLRTIEPQKKELKDFLKTPLSHRKNRSPCWNPTEKIGKTCLAVCCLLIWFTIVLQFPGRFRRLLLGLCLLVSYPPDLPSTIGAVSFLFTSVQQKKHIGTSFLLVGFLSCCQPCHIVAIFVAIFLLLSFFRYRYWLVLMLSHLRLSFLPLLRPWF